MNISLLINYPIAPQYTQRLGGAILNCNLSPGSLVNFENHNYTIHNVYPITLKLWVHSNILKVFQSSYCLSGTAQLKRFSNLLGIMDQKSFIQHFFRNASIVDTTAVVNLYFVSFTEENIFRSWNA